MHERLAYSGEAVPMTETNTQIVLLGPFWTRSKTIHDLGCSAESLLNRRDVLRIGARMSEEVYPAFQFQHHQVREEIGTVVELLIRHDVTGAVICNWFVHANPDLDGIKPLEWLNRGRPRETVLDSARRSISVLQAATAQLRSHNLPYEGHYGPDS
jgi:hypothetical protein